MKRSVVNRSKEERAKFFKRGLSKVQFSSAQLGGQEEEKVIQVEVAAEEVVEEIVEKPVAKVVEEEIEVVVEEEEDFDWDEEEEDGEDDFDWEDDDEED